MTHVSFFPLPFILFFGLMFAIVLLVTRIAKRQGWAVVLLVPLVLLVVGFFALFTLRASVSPSPVNTGPVVETTPALPEAPTPLAPLPGPEAPPMAEAPSPAAGQPPAPNFDDELYADKYPSAKSGAVALTRRMLESLDKLLPTGVKLGAFTVEGMDGRAPAELLAAMADAARARLPGVNVGLAGMPVGTNQGEIALNMQVRVQPITSDVADIHATLARPDNNANLMTDQVRTENKPWVQDLAHAPSSGGIRFVVHSDLCGSPSEANDKARNMAADRLVRIFEDRLAPSFATGRIRESEERWLRQALWYDLNWKERFDRQITRPYGKLCQQSLLVDIPDAQLASMASRYERSLGLQRTGWRHTLLAAGGLALGIIVLYLFLNAATKGYYMWPLRLLGVVAVAAGVVIVLRMA